MKKYQVFILFVVTAVLLSACSAGKKISVPPRSPVTSSYTPPAVAGTPTAPIASPELPEYSFEEILLTAPTRFDDGGEKIAVWVSGEKNYYGEISIGGKSYVNGASGNIDGTYALFVTDTGSMSLNATIRDDGYYGTYTDRGSVQNGSVEFPFNAAANAGSLSTCKKNHEVTLNISGINYVRVFWSRSSRVSTDATYKMLTVVISKDEAVRYVQDGTLPAALQGLTVTGLDKIFGEPQFSGDTSETGGVVSISTSDAHALAVMEDGSLWAWGWNANGQLGDGTNVDKASPVKVMDDVVSAYAGVLCSFAITSDGTLWAWGSSQGGKLGIGTGLAYLSPVEVMDNVAHFEMSNSNSFAIKSDGSLWAWGAGQGGLFGGTPKDRNTPEHIADDVASISVAYGFCYVIKTDGSLWVFGTLRIPGGGEYKNDYTEFTQILEDVVSVSVGANHAFAIKSDGTLWAWGRNDNYQIGSGTTEVYLSPVKVLDDVAYVTTTKTAEFVSSFAIKTDGSLWAWGDNTHGQLGNGESGRGSFIAQPASIMDNVVYIASASSSYSLTMALTSDGGLWAWGENSQGQFADDSKDPKPTPVQIMENVKLVEAYNLRVFIVKEDGSLWSWGDGADPVQIMG